MKALWKERANYLNEVKEAQRLLLLPESVPQTNLSQFILEFIEEDGHNLMEGMHRVMLNHFVSNSVKKLALKMPHKATVGSKVYFSDLPLSAI